MRPAVISILVAVGMLAAAASRPARADDPVSSSVRYNREIVRIFERKCVACHADRSLSIPLDSYHDVRPWAQAIREEILERRMPPWPAAPGVRPLANELALTTREIAIITAWIDGGTPRGEPSDLPAATSRAPWRAGEPAMVLALPAQQVTADGRAYVRRVTVATGLARDRWLRGFDVVPGERRALRSVFLYARHADGEQWLGGWTPWYAMTHAPEHVGFKLRAGASLDVELHYAAWDESERPLTDASSVGLYFHAERPDVPAETLTVSATSTGTATAVRGEVLLRSDTVVWAIRPRIGREGAAQPGALELRAVLSGGRIEPLLWIKEHQPEWQLPYVLSEPLRLPRGARIVLTAHGDDLGSANVAASLLTHPAAASSPTPESLKEPRLRPAR